MRQHVDDLVDRRRHRGQPGVRRAVRPEDLGQAGGLIALQRAAGNRAVARLLRADVGAAQGVAGATEEEYPEPGQGTVSRAVAGPAGPRPVQRVARWRRGPVHQVNNLADSVVNGTPAGVTWPLLNGTQFWSVAEAQGAIARPTVTTTAVAAGGFEAEVDTIPTNTGSFDETVLRRGPWRLVTAKATIGAMFPTLPTCTGAGDTRFRAYGSPSDAAMFAANRRHENHHARDHRVAFNSTVKPWDAKLTAAKRGGQTFQGATAAEAEAALWAAMGGTPDEIAEAFMNACAAAVVAYHGSPAGGPIGAPAHEGCRNNCAISWAKYTNPS
jgi:hypothetical protein